MRFMHYAPEGGMEFPHSSSHRSQAQDTGFTSTSMKATCKAWQYVQPQSLLRKVDHAKLHHYGSLCEVI